jgi:hypothetical protein
MAAIQALKQQPDVLYAEPNYLLYLDATPNDPRFTSGELYGLTKIGAPTAWNTTTGNSSVVVGVIDEGIDKLHPDLQANIWTNPAEIAGNGVDDDGNGFIDDVNGYNFAANTGTIPAENHATHVAGTIGAVGNNSIGVVGVNWQVSLMSLRFINGSSGVTSNAIRACNYSKQMHDLWVSTNHAKGANVRVLNNSYGGGSFSQSFLDAISGLNQSGILFVAAAGNAPDSPEPNNDIVPHYPSSYDDPNVIGVAATNSTDALASFSHFGATSVHIGAPGVGILSTTANNTYSTFNGTSMASPHVAGAAALLLAANPNLTVTQLRSLLMFNGDPVTSLVDKTLTGRRLNVGNSMQTLNAHDVTPPGTVTNFHLNSQNGRALNVGWTDSGGDGAVGHAALYELSFTDATTGSVEVLKRIVPAGLSPTEAVDVKLPYRHISGTLTLREFDNSGNEGVPATTSVSVSLLEGDPYITSLSNGNSPALSTGGTPLALIGDDKIKLNYALPFTFPFFGENLTTVNITTNGNLFFSAPPKRSDGDADDVPASSVGLTKFKMISGLWDDLRTDRTGGDVYVVTPDANRIIFRWQTVTFGNGTAATELPVNFEIELRRDGTILTRYGAGQQSPNADTISRVVGISAGEPDAYVILTHTSEGSLIDLTNAQQVTFTPRVGSILTVTSVNPISGVNITVTPADNNSLGNGATPFTRTYNDSTVVNLTAPATVGGNNFLKWQRDGVDWATTPATSITIDANRTMTAVYVTPRTLTMASSNPSSGVNITVNPADRGSLGDGATPFTRTYNDGTNVNLTAPATSSGNNFLKWQRDGVDWATTQATSVTMEGNHTMTAVFISSVQFSVSQFDVAESDASATITVTRSGDTSTQASIDYATSDGSATQKGDFTFVSGRLTFAAGETSKSFPVLIVDDVFQEGTETFSVALSNPVGTVIGVRSVASVAIFDNDLSPGTTNPLDNADAQFFVRQHYLDFLNREPDAAGLAFWKNQITSCGSDTQCIEIRRINVSAAFFLSIEFQETGYLVYKMYKVAYGNLPGAPVPVRYDEFLPDSQQIAKGVQVGIGNWQAQLDSNKVAFANDFVTRARFATAYATTLMPAQFVDALIAKAAFTPTASERQAFIDEFGTATTTVNTTARARVVRAIAENGTFHQQELNKAFVLMQYFGYLRRNPYDPPEPTLDYGGYNFWLGKLNQFNGNFVTAEMVKAFLVSSEYRQRFGP